ncbi:MAG TPA: DUF1800 domain-containing protein [Burkholderiales bacterium]|nr:DUF1800 domain-containing protein [Burkholderiales bacterium]
MRLLFLFGLVLLPLQGRAAGMGYDEARLLLNRTGFAASENQVNEFAKLSREQAVERILRGARDMVVTAPPAWVNDPITPPRILHNLSPEERKTKRQEEIRKGIELRAWWLQEMIATPSPLTEKMTLFWHNHFVSSQQKVRYSKLMYQQNVLLRKYALGNFGELLHAVSKDPAMIVYLDSATNRKGHPNENFAREVMELFTLGEGHYTETDVKEAARAFTGWSIEPETGEFRWRPFFHDDGIKTVLHKSGNLEGDAVLDILLAQPDTADFIVAKMWREFIAPTPDPREVARIADQFRGSHYEIKIALRAILLSDAFYSQNNRALLIKSPVELVVGTLRQFDFSVPDALPFAFAAAQLGQNLFSPPNVKGWPGGEAWINSATLLARKQFLERLFRAQEMPQLMRTALKEKAKANGAGKLGMEQRERLVQAMEGIQFDADRWLSQFNVDPRAQAERLVLATAPVDRIDGHARGLELIREITRDPVYQLE